jgi:hypothetical protein
MPSKTYKRKNTKSKNKKKAIKTLKKINIKRNNRRSKIRSNIRKIIGGGSIKWNSTTGFIGEVIKINEIDKFKGKKIKVQIQSDNHINYINQAINFEKNTPIPDISNKTLIEGVLKKIEYFTENYLLHIEFRFKDGNKRHVVMTEQFIVCNPNVVCKKNNDLSMFEIEGIEGIEGIEEHNNKNLQYVKMGTQNPNIQPNANNIQPNNNLNDLDMEMFEPAK